MIPRDLIPYALGAAVLGAVWLHGQGVGADRAESRHLRALAALQAEYDAISEDASRAEAARLQSERERDALQRELEEQATADADAGRRALGAPSVLRIDRAGRQN